MLAEAYLKDVIFELKKQKDLADRAMAQVDGTAFFRVPDPESNSLALIVKHMAGNQRSRWTDFLTSDGEKPDRKRDSEFVVEPADTRESLLERWEAGWRLLFETLGGLRPADLERTVFIRGEAHSVLQAIQRQIAHYSEHVGQIIFLAKHLAGDRWKTLSVPRAQPDAREAHPAIAGVGQIALTVKDLARSVAFYRDALGLRFLFQPPGMAFFDCGGMRLMLALPEKPGDAGPSSSVIYFR